MAESTEPPDDSRQASALAVDIFSGLGLGLLLGIVVGLSITPVVSIVVGALASLLAVFLGLEGGEGAKVAALRKVRVNGIRIGSFGFATVVGLLLGLFIRANDPLAEPIDQHLARWSGFPDTVAQQMVIFERTGIAPKSLSFTDGAPAVEVVVNEAAAIARRNVLVGARQEQDLCDELTPAAWGNDPEKLLRRYDSFKDELLTGIATEVRKAPEDHRLNMLIVAHRMFCELQKEKGR